MATMVDEQSRTPAPRQEGETFPTSAHSYELSAAVIAATKDVLDAVAEGRPTGGAERHAYDLVLGATQDQHRTLESERAQLESLSAVRRLLPPREKLRMERLPRSLLDAGDLGVPDYSARFTGAEVGALLDCLGFVERGLAVDDHVRGAADTAVHLLSDRLGATAGYPFEPQVASKQVTLIKAFLHPEKAVGGRQPASPSARPRKGPTPGDRGRPR